MRSLFVGVVVFAACGKVENPPAGTFTVAVEPGRVFVRQGEVQPVDVTVTRDDNFDAAVDITVDNLPTGVTAMPLTIGAAETTGRVMLAASGTAIQGIANVAITGSGEDTTADAPLRLLVGGAPGTLDTSFATDGTFTPALNNMALASRGLAFTDQGLVVTGFVVSNPPQAMTVRVLENGSLDDTYGSGGFVSTGVGNLAEGIAIAAQPDGGVVVAGIAGGGGGECEFGIFRYDDTGALDPAFGASGVAAFDPGTGCAEYHNIALAPNGDILVGGMLFGNTISTRAFRYSPAGVKGAGFDVNEPDVSVEGSAIQTDGKLVMAGSLAGDFWLARYNPNGTRDTGFGANGIVTTDFAPDTANANGVIALPGGKLLAVGIAASGTNKRVCLARYNANGSLDVTFGAGGKTTTAAAFDSRSPTALAVSGTQVLFVGVRNAKPAVVRVDDTGSIDAAFGDAGVTEIDFGVTGTTTNTGGFGIAIDPDGRILVSGDVGPSGGQKMAIARLWP